MKLAKPGNLKIVDINDIRNINQTILLHLIRERQPISRVDIARITGLRPGTISSIVNRLIRKGVIFEGAEGPSSGGRKPTYLNINAENAYVLAIDIGVRDTAYAVSDFNGRILKQNAIITEGEPNEFLNRLADEVQRLIAAEYGRAKFAGVGVSVPGLVRRETGEVAVSPNLGWTNLPVKAFLESKLNLPVYVENDANAAAFSELWYGPLDEIKIKTLLYILVVDGLGCGLIINGELHVGSKVGMGGFGHMCIEPNGELCSCGRKGCWETLASESATIARYHRLMSNKNGSITTSITDIIGLANRGDEKALAALTATAEYLGEGIASLAHGLSPEIIVVGGEISAAWNILGPVINERIKSQYIIPDAARIDIRPASVQRPSLFGAIPIALQNFF
ncbi:MAG TPA: ROK family transcriptional regulator [Pyrinomonadaceae bacterium]|nr:ROK family transcriptional regulator [Pyrinomonadaceae bacterium]